MKHDPAAPGTTVLRVARAICEAMGDDWNREGRNKLLPAYRPSALAAIQAMERQTDA